MLTEAQGMIREKIKMATYQDALREYRKTGVSRCSDAALMAEFCKSDLPFIAGAVSPKLVWEGAQRRGLTTLQLAGLAVNSPSELEELQWS
jgi:hypothetical protein